MQRTQEQQKELAGKTREIISFLKPNITINIIDDFTKYNKNAVPVHVRLAPPQFRVWG